MKDQLGLRVGYPLPPFEIIDVLSERLGYESDQDYYDGLARHWTPASPPCDVEQRLRAWPALYTDKPKNLLAQN